MIKQRYIINNSMDFLFLFLYYNIVLHFNRDFNDKLEILIFLLILFIIFYNIVYDIQF